MSIDIIKNIIKEEMENYYSQSRVGDTSNIREENDDVLDEIIRLAELLDPNHMISYIPQGYEHNILDENS